MGHTVVLCLTSFTQRNVLRFIQVVTCIAISFSWLHNNSLHRPQFASPFICGHLGCFHGLAPVNNAAMDVGVQMSETLLSILLGIYSEVEVLGHVIILFFIVEDPSYDFPQLVSISHSH